MPTRIGDVRPITRWGDPVVHARCAEVTDFDVELAQLVADLFATMYAADGVGLAANQVGIDLQVFVFECPDADGGKVRGAICNPRLELPSGPDRRLHEGTEGCLSLPGAYSELARPDSATVTGFDVAGKPISFQGTGMLARCLQHETDHLFGTVLADRLTRKQRKRLYAEADEIAHRYPADWPISPIVDDEAAAG